MTNANRVYFGVALILFCVIGLFATCAGQFPPPQASAPDPITQRVVMSPGPLYVSQFSPPEQYQSWYHSMERCTGLAGDYSEVQWFVVPHAWRSQNKPGGITLAIWLPPHRIVLNADNWRDSVLVSHEIVHDLLARYGLQNDDDPHPVAYFGMGKCAKAYWP